MVVIELDMSCTLARLRSLLCGLSSIALCDDENEGVVYSDVAAIYELIQDYRPELHKIEVYPDGGPAEEASS